MKLKELLEEFISKKYGTYYHRTDNDFSQIMKSKFKSGSRGGFVGMGEGWYFATSLDFMRRYKGGGLGSNIIKARVDHSKVFFTDSKEAIDIAEKVHGGRKVRDQFKSIGIPLEGISEELLNKEIISVYEVPRKANKYMEGYMYGKKGVYLFISPKRNVLNNVIPYAISKDEGKTWEKIEGSKYKKRAFKIARDKL